MAGIVLALAGLTCGDGGPGLGAAREPVGVKIGDGFRGFVRFGTAGRLCPAEMHGRTLHVRWPRETRRLTDCTFQPNGSRGFWLRWNDYVYRGTIEEKGGHLILTIDEDYLGGRVVQRFETIRDYIPSRPSDPWPPH
jgi:hypothetical protein